MLQRKEILSIMHCLKDSLESVTKSEISCLREIRYCRNQYVKLQMLWFTSLRKKKNFAINSIVCYQMNHLLSFKILTIYILQWSVKKSLHILFKINPENIGGRTRPHCHIVTVESLFPPVISNNLLDQYLTFSLTQGWVTWAGGPHFTILDDENDINNFKLQDTYQMYSTSRK